MKEKVLFSWSGGKDSAIALYELRKDPRYEIVALLTTVSVEYDRICMHGVRRELLERQAEHIGLPLEEVMISSGASNEQYESAMAQVLGRYCAAGVSSVAFGDIFLEDLRKYRQDKLASAGMGAIFPIWKIPTHELARRFIELGFETILTCVDTQVLNGRFAGRNFDQSLLDELPGTVDCCGENGEFHSFCWGGPIFEKPVACRIGGKVLRDQRWMYCDVLPA